MTLLTIILMTWVAGLCAVIGGFFASLFDRDQHRRGEELRHAIVAFGGGILLAAVVYALLPEGLESLPLGLMLLCLLAGGAAFCALDIYLARRGSNNAQFLAMLMDFIPEALSLGAVFAVSPQTGILLALFIGAQNLPEGFNAFAELRGKSTQGQAARSSGRVLTLLALMSLLGPLAALLGYYTLRDATEVTAAIMTFAGGGIIYLVFQDIAPKASMPRHWLPTLGAVAGFSVGLVGQQLLSV
ncbi:ZIP family metal transporter [Idiomarina xiamenensis]|uniref:Divalent heavy-metal cations transporter n=1 Tax=Idiomarina xiamenensis 10-D-4 TaxID=740709 RepID=K2JHR4_9GAMM|nr:divalent cation transporter [Idiomarina xiamenensis]EKE82926.1 divalent heavy-metal cations transporter [Idiomarina xiamenensis 10-D-4]